ncbi:MAG: sigma-70 family RNA polymerase sigma factor [Chitinophagaceae bacterium]|nr:sigma-70 family RNA polymerase sigma factor [Chitinophagaceae bacterium]
MYKDHETPQFWITYQAALRRYVELKIQDKHSVDDIMHEVYLKVFCYCKRFEFSCEKAGVKNLDAWIFRVCHNVIVDHHKRNSRYSYNVALEGLESPSQCDEVSTRYDPALLAELVKSLPAKYAQAVLYDAVDKLKQKEIADKLGLSLTATKSRIQRGKKMLFELYQQILQK